MSIAIGVFAGALSGLFGVGGGLLAVPGLVMFGKMDQRLAQGTSLVAVAPIGLAGMIGYALGDSVDWVVSALLLVGSVVGTFLGTRLLRTLPPDALRWSFGALLVITAVRMLFDAPVGTGRPPLGVGGGIALVAVGLFTGALAGLMGVGGGVVMVPAQNVLFSIPAALAKGTSLAVIVPTAIAGSIQNLRHGTADLTAGATVGVSGMLTSFLFSRVALGLDPTLSAVLYALLLLFSAAGLLIGGRRRQPVQAME